MQINLQNAPSGTFTTTGPTVIVDMIDMGQAQVALTLAISDGTIFSSDGATTSPGSTLMPPGTYTCALVISAFNHGAFGKTYDSVVRVNGTPVATATGAIPQNSTSDSAATAFFLKI